MTIRHRIQAALYARRRKTLAKKCPEGVLKRFLSFDPPSISDKIIDTEFLVADFEMTGLSPSKDKIISIGTTLIRSKKIVHSEAKHQLIYRPEADLTNSAPIHKIFESNLLEGKKIKEVLESFLQNLKGRVLVLHHSGLDRKFLNTALKNNFSSGFLCLSVDTMKLEFARLKLRGEEPHNLDLANTRHRYGLPTYVAHNAAIDALATAELFLAQLTYLDPDNKELLSSLV